MLKNIVKTAALSPLLLLLLFGCGTAKSEGGDQSTANTTRSAPPPTDIAKETFRNEPTETLCDRLHEIKKLPYRDPDDTDQIYEALIAKGRDAMPCLIEKITDETPMEDPREAPPWQQYKVGDTAVFILLDIADRDKDLIPEMLPPKYKREWETNGVYAYFNYVREPGNRKELQNWWRNWMNNNMEK